MMLSTCCWVCESSQLVPSNLSFTSLIFALVLPPDYHLPDFSVLDILTWERFHKLIRTVSLWLLYFGL